MQSFAIRAVLGASFRLTLDLSAWGALGVSLASATIRMQAFCDGNATPALEWATGGANPVVFDPATGLATFSAPAAALATLNGTYRISARAEFSTSAVPLFGGSLTLVPGVVATASAGLPSVDTAWIAAQPFGPAPVPGSIASAVASAQAAAASAFARGVLFGG